MKRLLGFIRKVHCIGTHQRFAIDALSCLQSDAGIRFAQWIARNYSHYLRGAIDPDVRFRDFHNHVIHVRDGFWGGAPRVAHQWYGRLQKHLRAERFPQAAHAAGVLSHYLTDVIQPLHTVSSEREAVVHRPLEWSIDCAYEQIFRTWKDSGTKIHLKLTNGPVWLGSLMMHSAKFSHGHIDQLLSRYRFQEAVENPECALDHQSVLILSELFALSITAIANVLDRAAIESESFTGYPIPPCHSNLAFARATITAPVAMLKRRSRYYREQLAGRELAEEYFRTGTLTSQLPKEVDIKQRVIVVRNQEWLADHRESAAA